MRCGKQYNPAAGGDALLCGECAATQPRIGITSILIGINVLVFVAMMAAGVSPLEPTSQDLLTWGASYGPFELSTEWWRLFTAMFVHIGFLHILLNLYCLWSLGPLAERLFGRWKFLWLYLLSGVGGNVASVALHPTIVAAGASGAIFGVAGALLPVLHLREIPAIVSLRGRGGRLGIGSFIVYNLVYGFANSGIDNAAHIGGLVIGFIIGYSAPVAGSHTGRPAAWRSQGILIALALFLGAAFVVVREWRASYGEVEFGRRALIAGDTTAGIAHLQRVLRTDPDNETAHLLLGGAFLDQGKITDAIDEFDAVLREDSTNSLALENLGVAYLRSNRPGDALAPLERVQSRQPGNARTNFNLGLANLATKQYETALFYFSQALRIRPNYSMALVQRGFTYSQIGKTDSARADYQRALRQSDEPLSEAQRGAVRRLLAELPGH